MSQERPTTNDRERYAACYINVLIEIAHKHSRKDTPLGPRPRPLYIIGSKMGCDLCNHSARKLVVRWKGEELVFVCRGCAGKGGLGRPRCVNLTEA